VNPDLSSEREFQRLRWQCRRGTRELDLVLMGYLERRYRMASREEQCAFRALLDRPDQEIECMLWGPCDDSGSIEGRLMHALRGPFV